MEPECQPLVLGSAVSEAEISCFFSKLNRSSDSQRWSRLLVVCDPVFLANPVSGTKCLFQLQC